MANFKGHITGGLSIATVNLIIFTYLQDIKVGAITFATALIFSLYPDQDIKSKSQQLLTILGLIGILLIMYFKIDTMSVIIILGLIILPLLYKHRHFNHSIINGIVLCIVWQLFLSIFIPITFPNDYWYSIALWSGYGMHLVLDKHWKLI